MTNSLTVHTAIIVACCCLGTSAQLPPAMLQALLANLQPATAATTAVPQQLPAMPSLPSMPAGRFAALQQGQPPATTTTTKAVQTKALPAGLAAMLSNLQLSAATTTAAAAANAHTNATAMTAAAPSAGMQLPCVFYCMFPEDPAHCLASSGHRCEPPAVPVPQNAPVPNGTCLTSNGALALNGEVHSALIADFGAQIFTPSNGNTIRLLDQTENDACGPLPEQRLRDAAVLVERGGCSFYTKAYNAQRAGATALVIYNVMPMGMNFTRLRCEDGQATRCTDIEIPVMFFSHAVGAAIMDAKATNPLQTVGFTCDAAIDTAFEEGSPLSYGQLMLAVRDAATTTTRTVGDFDVSEIKTMARVFRGEAIFNSDVSHWATKQVSSMSAMFYSAEAFNADVTQWNTGSVTDMGFMFYGATAFNQGIGNWTTTNVFDMNGMFSGCTAFNQDLSGWDVTGVSSRMNPNQNPLVGMFTGVDNLYHDLTRWDVPASALGENFAGHDVDLTGYRTSAPASVWDAASIAAPNEAQALHHLASTFVIYADTSYDVAIPANYASASTNLLRGFANTSYAVERFDVSVEPRTTDLVYVDAHKGTWVIAPDQTHVGLTFTTQLKAFDATGAGAPLTRKWAFQVAQRPQFNTTDAWRAARSLGYPTKYQINETYTLAAPAMEREQLFQGFANGDNETITYAMVFSQAATGAKQVLSFFVNDDGKTLVEPSTRAEIGAYHGVLQATDGAGKTAEVYSWDFEVLDSDLGTPSYGPNSTGCLNGGNAVDTVHMDQHFECDCAATDYVGSNCHTPKPAVAAAASQGNVDTATVAIITSVASVLGAILIVTLLVAARTKYYARQKANAPADFNAQLQQLKDMGLIDDEVRQHLRARASRAQTRLAHAGRRAWQRAVWPGVESTSRRPGQQFHARIPGGRQSHQTPRPSRRGCEH